MNTKFAISTLALTSYLFFAYAQPSHAEPSHEAGAIVKDKPTVVFITGDDEYHSREIMLPFAKKLEEDYGFKVIYLTTPLTEGATPILLAYGTGKRDPDRVTPLKTPWLTIR